jgi:hypothetical protein
MATARLVELAVVGGITTEAPLVRNYRLDQRLPRATIRIWLSLPSPLHFSSVIRTHENFHDFFC